MCVFEGPAYLGHVVRVAADVGFEVVRVGALESQTCDAFGVEPDRGRGIEGRG